MIWNLQEAIDLCRKIEAIVPKYGCHVSLTGGVLYKESPRKDLDLLFYRIRQAPEIKMDKMWDALEAIGIVKKSGFGWCYKATIDSKPIDIFFPEEQNGEYNPDL